MGWNFSELEKALNILYSYLTQTKMYFSKSREQEGKAGPVWGMVPMGGWRI
jgi:hypothetical protein